VRDQLLGIAAVKLVMELRKFVKVIDVSALASFLLKKRVGKA